MIRQRIATTQSQQKSYAKVRRRPLEFEVGDFVFIKVALMNGVMRFGKKGKQSLCYVGPYEVVKRISVAAYEIVLTETMSAIHSTFHVSMLNKCVADPEHVIELQVVQIQANLSYEEQPIQIIYREVKKLRNKEIDLVKVLWKNHRVEEATWESEEEMRVKHRALF